MVVHGASKKLSEETAANEDCGRDSKIHEGIAHTRVTTNSKGSVFRGDFRAEGCVLERIVSSNPGQALKRLLFHPGRYRRMR